MVGYVAPTLFSRNFGVMCKRVATRRVGVFKIAVLGGSATAVAFRAATIVWDYGRIVF